jgi:hypothetical protein
LRAGQRLDALDIVDVDFGHARRRGNRHVVEIGAAGGQRAAIHGNATEVDFALARAEAGEADRRQHAGIIGKRGDLVLFQLFRAEGLDRNRHLLHAFGLARGGHHDFAEPARARIGCGGSGAGAAAGAVCARAATGSARLERTVEAPRKPSARLIGDRCSNTIVHAP